MSNTTLDRAALTDLEATRLCAEAMGWEFFHSKHGYWNLTSPEGEDYVCCNHWQRFDPYTGAEFKEPTAVDALIEIGYDPLNDDAQAFALVRKFPQETWRVINGLEHKDLPGKLWTLNRAIVYCVAAMQQATTAKGDA